MKNQNISYFPRPISGQTFPGYVKINKLQVKKFLEHGGKFTGFIVGNKVNSFHFFGGWTLAYSIECKTMEEFERSLNSFLFYLDPELGDRAAIYLKK